MRIGVLGTGKVAVAIASHWTGAHDVLFGNREGQRPEDPPLPPAIKVGTLREAAAHGEAVLLAVPAPAMEAVVIGLTTLLAGKVLLDCSNRVSPVDHDRTVPALSMSEEIAGWVPDARVVKIFNTTGVENLAEPGFVGEKATMFFATDDEAARLVAGQLATECGFDAVYAGPLTVARDLEWLTRFWGTLAYGQKLGRRIAFRLLRQG